MLKYGDNIPTVLFVLKLALIAYIGIWAIRFFWPIMMTLEASFKFPK